MNPLPHERIPGPGRLGGMAASDPDGLTRAEDLDASSMLSTPETCALPPRAHVAPAGRYIPTSFHARGGMGEIWRCRDANVGREVAIKRLVSDRPAARERFLCEAQITGQLEHPGIVPVHDVGFDETGEPFYVMKFVRGRTLKVEIEDFHHPEETPTKNTAREGRETRRVRLLKIFLDLCHAVAYAHSRGVIHRDLKPDNVMLGEYGETVVLDWGLAKLRGCAEPADDGAAHVSLNASFSGNSAQTEDGSILGSPLYMPPEMAGGHPADVDVRADVYLLGATLYEILTGRPPRQGRSRDELLELARTSPPPPPRKLVADTPRALEAICEKAMARSPGHRYPSAMSVAEDVQRYLAGEPVSACRESIAQRAWRWTKRHRRGLTRAATAVALIVSGATAIAAWRDAALANAREQARTDVLRIRNLADEACFYAAGIDPPGETVPCFDAGRGEESALSALALADRWGARVEKLPLAGEQDALRMELADLSLLVAQLRLTAGVQQGPRELVSRIVPLLDRADTLRGRATRRSMALRAQLYRLTRQSDEANLAQLAADDPATPVTATDHFLDGERIRLDTTGDELGIPMLRDAGQRKRKTAAIQLAIDCYRAALKLDPSHYWSRLQLGRCYLAEGRGPEAIESLSTCIALRPDAPWGYTARGLALATLGRFDEARQDLDHAMKLDPQSIPARLNRGAVALLGNRLDEAVADFDAIYDSTGKQPVEALFYRGQILMRRGNTAAAIGALQPITRERPQFVPAYVLLAQAQLLGGQTADALATLDSMIAMTRRQRSAGDDARATRGHLLRLLAAQLPPDRQRTALEAALTELAAAARTGQSSANTFNDLGAVLHQLRRFDEAIEAFGRAVELSPADLQPHINRGWTFEAVGKLTEAMSDFDASRRLRPDSAEATVGLGYVLASTGRISDAQTYASLALLHGGNDYVILHNVACIYARLSTTDAARRVDHEDTALAVLDRAMDMWRASLLRGHGGPSEMDLIRTETAFPAALKAREAFKSLFRTPQGQTIPQS